MEPKDSAQTVENMEGKVVQTEKMEVSNMGIVNNEDGFENFRLIWDQNDGESAMQAGVTSDGDPKEYLQISEDEWLGRMLRVDTAEKTMQEFKKAYAKATEMTRTKTIRMAKLRKVPKEAVAGILAEMEARQQIRVLTWTKEAQNLSANTAGMQPTDSDVWVLLDKWGETFYFTEGKRQIKYDAVEDYTAFNGTIDIKEEWSMFTGRGECVAFLAGADPRLGMANANFELRQLIEDMVGNDGVARDALGNCRIRQVGERKGDMVYEIQASTRQMAIQMHSFLMQGAVEMTVRDKKAVSKQVSSRGKKFTLTDNRRYARLIGNEMMRLSKKEKRARDKCTVMVKYKYVEGKAVHQVRVQDVQAAVDVLGEGIVVWDVLPTRKRREDNEFSIVVDSSESAVKLAENCNMVFSQIWQIKDEEEQDMWKKRANGTQFAWKSDGGSSDSSGDESLHPQEDEKALVALRELKAAGGGLEAYEKALNQPLTSGWGIPVTASRSIHRPASGGLQWPTDRGWGEGQEDRAASAKMPARGRGGGGDPVPKNGVEEKLGVISNLVDGLVRKIKSAHDDSPMDTAGEVIISETADGPDIDRAVAKAEEKLIKAHKQELETVEERALKIEKVLSDTTAKLGEVQQKLGEVEKSSKKTEIELVKKKEEIVQKDAMIETLKDKVAVLTGDMLVLKDETETAMQKLEEASKSQHKELQIALADTKKQLVENKKQLDEKDREMAKEKKQAAADKRAQEEINVDLQTKMSEMFAAFRKLPETTEEGWVRQGAMVNTPERETEGGGKSAKRVISREEGAEMHMEPATGSGQMDEEGTQAIVVRTTDTSSGGPAVRGGREMHMEPATWSGQMAEEGTQASAMSTIDTSSGGLEVSGGKGSSEKPPPKFTRESLPKFRKLCYANKKNAVMSESDEEHG